MKSSIAKIGPFTLILAAALTAVAASPAVEEPAVAAAPAPQPAPEVEPLTPGDDHKMTICHRGHTISIDVAAWPAHEAHGDQEGVCAGPCFTNADCEEDEFCYKGDAPWGSFESTFPVDDCGDPGSCEIVPDACFGLWDPVCGCDGVTYSNPACAWVYGATNVASTGECE